MIEALVCAVVALQAVSLFLLYLVLQIISGKRVSRRIPLVSRNLHSTLGNEQQQATKPRSRLRFRRVVSTE